MAGIIQQDLLKDKNFLTLVEDNKPGGVKGRSQSDFIETLQIPLPPLEVQNEIVEKIEKQKQIIEGAERIEESWRAQIGLPQEITKKFVKEVALIKSGGTPLRSELVYWEPAEIPWVKTGEINYSDIFETEEKISKEGALNSSAKIIPANTLLMAMYGQGVTRGRVAILRVDAAMNQACAAFTQLSSDVDLKYLFYYLMSKYESIRGDSFGTNQENLSASIIEEFIIEYPPLETQRQIVEKLDKQMQALEGVRLLKSEAQQRIEEIVAGVWGK